MAETKSPSPRGILRFGVFQANIAARELRKHGVRVRLPGQPFCILSMLLERSGEIVTREEMRQRLWALDTFVDFEHSLNSAIKKLRAALNDSPENSRYIETVPRVGYRFVAPVEEIQTVGQSAPLASVATPDAQTSVDQRASSHRSREARLAVSAAILIVVVSGAFVWSRFRRQPPGQIAGEIHPAAKTSVAATSTGQPAPSSESPEARDLYIKGMYFWNERTSGGFHQAIEYFQQAIKIDPNYAAAYAGLANSYTLLTGYSSASAALYVPQARAAALRAVELDQNLAEAHTALALIVQNHDWDWQTSEKEYRRAIELNPDYATAHHWYAEHLMWLGRFDEALEESERARQLDPLSFIIATDHGAILYFSRQYDRAIEQLQTVLRKNPNFPRAVSLLTLAYLEKGMFTQALTQAETLRRLYGDGPEYWTTLTHIYGRAGLLERARREMDKLEKLNRLEPMNPVIMLEAYLGVGNKEEALAELDKARSEHFDAIISLKVNPAFDPLRSDPRFQDLLRRVGLADSSPNGQSRAQH